MGKGKASTWEIMLPSLGPVCGRSYFSTSLGVNETGWRHFERVKRDFQVANVTAGVGKKKASFPNLLPLETDVYN